MAKKQAKKITLPQPSTQTIPQGIPPQSETEANKPENAGGKIQQRPAGVRQLSQKAVKGLSPELLATITSDAIIPDSAPPVSYRDFFHVGKQFSSAVELVTACEDVRHVLLTCGNPQNVGRFSIPEVKEALISTGKVTKASISTRLSDAANNFDKTPSSHVTLRHVCVQLRPGGGNDTIVSAAKRV